MSGARVVITGIGLVTPLGIGIDTNWEALLRGRSGIGPITLFDAAEFPVRIAGEAAAFVAGDWLSRLETRTLDRFVQLAVVAGRQAMADSGLPLRFDDRAADRVGCFVGAGFGGIRTVEETLISHLGKTRRSAFSPYSVTATLASSAPSQIALRHNLRGPSLCPVAACTSGAHAVGQGMQLIRRGVCDVVLAGGAEAPISRLALGSFAAARALSTRNDAPAEASRPFDRGRDGFVMGEGAAILVLEEREHARRRGAHAYAEVLGYGTSTDAYHVTEPPPEGEGAQACMRGALEDAGLEAEAVDYVNAHGTSTRTNDRIETRALKAVFGFHARRLAVSSTKSMTGHLMGAAGAVEAAVCALALQRGAIPPTINLTETDPECDLDYVPGSARDTRPRVALSNSFGFGGMNASLVLGAA